MNGNDILDALSKLDPEYIDEAAFELKKEPEQKKKIKKFQVNKAVYVLLPAAAAVILTVTVLYSGLVRHGKSANEATAPMQEAAAEMPAEEGMAEESTEVEDFETAEEAPAYEGEASYESSQYDAAGEAADAAPLNEDTLGTGETDNAKQAFSAGEEASEQLKEDDARDASYDAAAGFMISSASCEKGILTLEIKGMLPSDIKNMEYSIKDGSKKTLYEGKAGDILKEEDPLSFDISKLELEAGTYTISLGGADARFTVK